MMEGDIYEKRQGEKAQRQRYRERAAQRVANIEGMTVATLAHVHPTTDGAFVEATIWVANEELEKEDAK